MYIILQIFQWINEKVANCEICEKIDFGKSFEGRPLVGIKVSCLVFYIHYVYYKTILCTTIRK